MPEDNPETGVKDVTEVSPASESQVATVESPAAESAVQKEPENKGHVPYLRFKEVNEKMRSYEAELAKLRSDKELANATKAEKVTSEDASDVDNEEEQMSKYEKVLAENGLDPKASKVLSRVMKDIAKEEAKERHLKETAKVERRQVEEKDRLAKSQKEIAEWQQDFRKAHADYADYEPLMQKRWEALDDGAKMALVSSPKSYELLYEAAKASKLESSVADGEQKGRDSAYENKSLKTAISSTPGSTANPGKKYTAEDVAKMSMKEYSDNKDKVMKDLGLRK